MPENVRTLLTYYIYYGQAWLWIVPYTSFTFCLRLVDFLLRFKNAYLANSMSDEAF